MWQVRNYPWLSYYKPPVGPSSGVLQVHRRRPQLGAAPRGAPNGRRGPHRAGGGARRTGLGVDRRGGGGRRKEPRRALPLGRFRRELDTGQRDGRSWVQLHESPDRGSRRPRHGVRRGSVAPALPGRRPDAAVFQGRARRGRLPLPLDQSEKPAIHGDRGGSGNGRHPERRAELDRLVQPADRPALPRRSRRSLSLLDLQRPAGQRHGRSREPQRLRAADLPRLASRRRRRARMGRAGSPGSADRLRHRPRGHDHAVGRADRPGPERVARPSRARTAAGRPARGCAGPGSSRWPSRARRPMRSTRVRNTCCARWTAAQAGSA